MEHQQRLAQVGYTVLQIFLGHIIEEFAFDAKFTPCQAYIDLTLLPKLVNIRFKQIGNVARVVGRGDSYDPARFGNFARGREHRGTAQTVAYQNCRRSMSLPQMIGGSDKVVYIRRKMRVGKFAFAAAQSGEIETQDTNAVHGQLLGDTFGRQHILAAGKAMREQRECGRLAKRQIKYRRQFFTLGIRKIKSFATHG